MKKIIILVLTLLSINLLAQSDAPSDSKFPSHRVPAVGEDRNATLVPSNQAGTLFTGSYDKDSQASTCPGCEHRNNMNLFDPTDIARPGIQQPDPVAADSARTGN